MNKLYTLIFLLSSIMVATVLANDRPVPKLPQLSSDMFSSVLCGPLEAVERIMQEYNEEVIFRGDLERENSEGDKLSGIMIITLNKKTGSWTAYEIYRNKQSCIMQGGDRGRLVISGPTV